MLPWKRNRSRDTHDVESMENTPISNNSKLRSNLRSFLGLSSRVFSGQFLVDVCNSIKTKTNPMNPSQKLANPTKMIKRWDPSELGLSLATSIAEDLAAGSGLDVPKTTSINVIHRSMVLSSNDRISIHSSSKPYYEDGIDGELMYFPNSGIEGPSDYMVMSHSKSFFRLPIDQDDRNYVEDVGRVQEEKVNEVEFFSSITSPRIDNFFSPSEFMKYCHSCKKILDHGKDIYIYRGDKAFCCEECREQEMYSDQIKLKKKRLAKKLPPRP